MLAIETNEVCCPEAMVHLNMHRLFHSKSRIAAPALTWRK